MCMTRHHTISVFQRYRIVSDDDPRVALRAQAAALARVPEAPARTGRGTIRGTTRRSWYTPPGLSR